VRRRRFLSAGAALLSPRIAAASLLDDVRARGRLRVASTFDYRPFAYRADGQPAGLDVDLAHDLAASLGVALGWVETTWSTLLDDLRADRFDIAMSGVSVTPARAAVGLFTMPYLHTGKTALARCDRVAQFRALAAIDRDDVTVIVNPGGSNEAWARAHLVHARIVVHADNVSIFTALERGDADLMITDAIEGESEQANHRALCIDPSAPYLEPVDKAWLLPNDLDLKRWLDAWLAARAADGTLAAAIARNTAATSRRD